MKNILSIFLIGLIIFNISFSEFMSEKRKGKIYKKTQKFHEKLIRNLQKKILLTHDEEPVSAPHLDPEIILNPEDYPTQVVNETLAPISKRVGNIHATISFLLIANIVQQPDKKKLQFNTFIKILARNPPKILSFFIRLFYLFRRNLRSLEEIGYYKNIPVKCELMSSSSTNKGVAIGGFFVINHSGELEFRKYGNQASFFSYECSAHIDDRQIEIAEINTELPMKKDGKVIPKSEITFSLQATEASNNMTNNTPIIDISKGMPTFYELNNGKVTINANKFIISGIIDNFQSNWGNSFKFKFPNKNEGGFIVENSCKVSKLNESNVEFECGPAENLEKESIHFSSGILNNKNIIVNMFEVQDKISIQLASSSYLDPMESIDLSDLSTEKVKNCRPIEKSIANRTAEIFILRISKSTKLSDTKLKFNIFSKFWAYQQ